jgi:RNA polymerase sigma factor (sigma-70 family)
MAAAFDDPAAFLEHDAFVRKLARGLLFDRAAADDAAQEAWLGALQARGPAPTSWRAWLAGTVRNLARETLRSKARRGRHEAERSERAPSGAPSASEVLEREAVRRDVVDAVLALTEPYRATVLLRWFENLPPREIARRSDVPTETVRTRLKRANAMLRERLDRAHGGDRATWAVSLHAFVFPKAPLAAASAIVGAFLMTTVLKVLAVVACVFLGGLWLFRGAEGVPPAAPPERIVASSEGPGELRPPASKSSDTAPVGTRPFEDAIEGPATSVETAPSLAEAFAEIEVVLVSARDGVPIPRAGVGLKSFGAGGLYRISELETDQDGKATARVAPGRVVASEFEGAEADAVVSAGGRAVLRLRRGAGATLRGRVFGPEGEPVSGATVRAASVVDSTYWADVAATSGDGAFEVRDFRPGPRRLFAWADGFGPSAVAILGKDVATELVFRLTESGGAVDGIILDDARRAVAGVDVRIEATSAADDAGISASAATLRARTDAAGTFRLRGAATGERRLAAIAPGFAPWRGTVFIERGGPTFTTVRLLRGVVVDGVVRDALGAPVARAEVRDASRGERAVDDLRTWTDPTGAFRLEGLVPGEGAIEAIPPDARGRATARFTAGPGETVRRDLVLGDAAFLRGRVVDHEGRLAAGVLLTVRRASSSGFGAQIAEIDVADGRFAVAAKEPGPFDVFVADHRAPRRPLVVMRRVAADGHDLVLCIPAAAHPTCAVRGVVQDATGAPVAGAEIDVLREVDDAPAVRSDRDGFFEAAPLPPGVVRVVVRAGGFAPRRLEPRRLEPNESWDAGIIRLERAGAVVVTAKLDDGVAGTDVRLRLLAEGGAFDERFVLHGGEGASAPLAAGRYRLHVAGRGVAETWMPVEVREGETTRLDVVVRHGREVRAVIRFPAGVVPTPVRVKVRGADGALVAEDFFRPDDGRNLEASFGLPDGAYRVDASADGLVASAVLRVSAEGRADVATLELR